MRALSDAAARLAGVPPRAHGRDPDPQSVLAGIRAIEAVAGSSSDVADDGPDGARPIFILATGWRTGSTLVQRILASDERVLIWGEPFAGLFLIGRLVDAVKAGASDTGERPWTPIESHADLATSWTANMFPPGADLRAGLRALFDRWLGRPAVERGYGRWGFKEVRYGAAEACVLQWLYPHAQFVVITRDPRDAYRSMTRGGWDRLPVETPGEFGLHWARLVRSWERTAGVLAPIRLRYEDVVAGAVDFNEIEARLGLRLDARRALDVRVGSTSPDGRALSRRERAAVTRAARAEMELLGYRV